MSSGANNKNSTILQLSPCGTMFAERKRERERKIKKESLWERGKEVKINEVINKNVDVRTQNVKVKRNHIRKNWEKLGGL